ncbi:hypothetical protein HNY73_007737 [Argiope bruennichi]|uniref:Uncharacterized protein n=1 Tax=Argiope bruennichi TaxID=94029 RepID=A0A8T0FET9_ARGBR|nr:hypothetical protein HNY73_007737 [Argiope bruennichi]
MTRKLEKVMSRKKFAVKLSEDLLAPWMKKRLDAPALPRSTRTIISELLKIDMVCELRKQMKVTKEKFGAFLPLQAAKNGPLFLVKVVQEQCAETHRANGL